ncbi:MAG: T9SS type A sorting domain-containing protein, partial [Bacteroidota bacterium]
LLIAVTTLSDDSISFYRKTSCEDGYDFLKFYINNTKAGEWTGYQTWKRVSFAVPAGSHVFKWTYEKDMYVSNYADKVWIDDVSFPQIATPAGEDEIYDFSAISIYPNPARNKQYMEFSLNRNAQVRVNLLDATGRKISELINSDMQAGSHKTSWDLSDLPSGLYLVEININGSQQVFKIIH